MCVPQQEQPGQPEQEQRFSVGGVHDSPQPELPGGARPFRDEVRNGGARSRPRPLPGSGPGIHQPPRPLEHVLRGGALFIEALAVPVTLPDLAQVSFDAITRWENLLLAYRRAAAGKRGQSNVAAFEHRLEENLLLLQHQLRDRTYRPGPYSSFHIHEPKARLISAAPFRDGVVHHALCEIIEPVFERGFLHDSYANRIGKGTHRALDRCQHFARRFRYVLQCDIRQFFPSIDHSILASTLARRIADPGILWLVNRILESGRGVLTDAYDMVYFPNDDLFAAPRPRGLPIGNLTSQFWANVYLDPFDHFIKRELGCPGYVRYVDDLLLFGMDKRELWHWKAALKRRLWQLRLTIHPHAQPRPVSEGIPFLGFVVFPDRRRLKRRKVVHFRRHLRSRIVAFRRGEISRAELTASFRGWEEHAGHGSTTALRAAIRADARAQLTSQAGVESIATRLVPFASGG